MKHSKQRDIILKKVRESSKHPDAYMIYEEAKKEISNISLGTVYRNLNQLAEIGEIKKISVPDGNDRFDKTINNHSHFHCLKCKCVTDIELELSIKNIELQNECKIISHDIVLNGICKDCLEEEN